MLHKLGLLLLSTWGPARLLTSHFFLAAIGSAFCMLLTFILIPKFAPFLPSDKGRQFAVNADKSVGKPLSAGIILSVIFAFAGLLFVPLSSSVLFTLSIVLLTSCVGFVDDRIGGLHEYTLALYDLVASLVIALVLFGLEPVDIWIPGSHIFLNLHPVIHIPLNTCVLWISINAMNCNDGVDGLSATLATISFFFLSGLLYVGIGNVGVAKYLLIPHNPDGALWGLLGILMSGCLLGYLWHNAPPSKVLMGDSGSRPVGLLLGVLVVISVNPFLLLCSALLVLANGATGILKVAFMRFLKVPIFGTIRFPLHDHVRKIYGWSDAQVLVRFALLHFFLTSFLFALILKIR